MVHCLAGQVFFGKVQLLVLYKRNHCYIFIMHSCQHVHIVWYKQILCFDDKNTSFQIHTFLWKLLLFNCGSCYAVSIIVCETLAKFLNFYWCTMAFAKRGRTRFIIWLRRVRELNREDVLIAVLHCFTCSSCKCLEVVIAVFRIRAFTDKMLMPCLFTMNRIRQSGTKLYLSEKLLSFCVHPLLLQRVLANTVCSSNVIEIISQSRDPCLGVT